MGNHSLKGPPTSVEGLVDRLFCVKPGFSAGMLRTYDNSLVKFAGPVYLREDDPVVLYGTWNSHPKYGRQFKVSASALDLKIDGAGLVHYLANNPEFKGIGPAKAQIIADAFQGMFDETIINNPSAVAKAARLPIETVLAIRKVWVENQSRNAAATCLAAYGLTHHQITTLMENFGCNVVPMLEGEPYLLVGALPGIGFRKVDKIARRMNTPKNSPDRIRAGLLHCIDQALETEGHCWVEYGDLIDRANDLLVMDELDSQKIIERHLDDLVREDRLACSPYEVLAVAKPEIENMELQLAEWLRLGQDKTTKFGGARSIARVVRQADPRLNRQQRAAVVSALQHRISLLSGGAGTGKTFTIRAVVDICRKRGLHVELAAPTGKAAKRLQQVVGQPARTIHRLLEFDGVSFARGPENPIDADVVVIDEVSMVDVRLAWRLFRAIDFSRTVLLLVGDHNQLPPVGPGNLLRDLIQSKAVPTTILPTVMRQAGELKENCSAILDGEVHPTSDNETRGRRPWYVVDQFTDASDVRRFILQLLDGVLAERLRFDLMRDVQVLSPTHKGPIGTRSLNIALQRLVQWKLYGVDVPPTDETAPVCFFVHDKVIQTRNNYTTGVMNGTVGIVADVSADGTLVVEFDTAKITVSPGSEELRDLQLAYCLSIHKCQGSEFPCAIVITHKSHEFQHHRNLLYTAVTRAQETAIIVGDRWGIRHCAQKLEVDRRNTFLSFLLSSDAEKSREEAHTSD